MECIIAFLLLRYYFLKYDAEKNAGLSLKKRIRFISNKASKKEKNTKRFYISTVVTPKYSFTLKTNLQIFKPKYLS